jgi:mono/diheme cytochrome c family protein
VFWLMSDRIDNIMYNSVPIHDKPAPFVDIKTSMPGSVQRGMDIKLIKNPSIELIASGKAAYQEKCAMCHGPEGKGDGPAGIANNARNFTSSDNWKNGTDLSKVFATLTMGLPPNMPSFDTVSVETRIALIHYVRSFGKHFPEVKDSEVESLDKQFNLSKETVNPHRVPIKVAAQVITKEATELNKKNHELVVTITADSSNGAVLLKSNTDNLEKTVYSLQTNLAWRKDVDAFVKFATVNVGANGLKAELLILDKAQLEGLFSYLKGIYK